MVSALLIRAGISGGLARWWRCILLAVPLVALGAAEPAGTPAPLASSPMADAASWVAAFDTQARAEYERNVASPHQKGVASVRTAYLAALDRALARVPRSGASQDAAAWLAERDRISSDPTALPVDDANAPVMLKVLRRNYRSELARLDKDREERARTIFARYDDMLMKKQAEFQAHPTEVATVQKERDQLRADWLPVAGVAAAAPAPPPPGAPGDAPAAKLTRQQILEKLRALGAEVAIKPQNGPVQTIASESQTVEGKFTFERVYFRPERPDQTPLTAADYDILDSLSEVEELVLSGPAVKDSVLEKLRPFRALKALTLNRARPSSAGYAVLPMLPALRQLHIYDTGATAEAMVPVTQCRKLQILSLGALAFEDEALADLGKLKELESLQLSELDKLTSKGFAHLAECRSLKSVSAGGFIVLSGMVENLGHCKSLEDVSLPNSFLKDAEVASLGELPKLRTLDLSNSPVTGVVFAQWRTHKEFTTLNLDNAAGIDDTVCQDIRKVFPQLQALYAKIAPTGFGKAGATALGRMRALRVVRLNGAGVTDEVADELTHDANITNLDIPLAQLTDAGAAALGRLSHLTELSLDMPPITDAAVKSFARCKELKTVNIGKDALPDTESKLQSAVPGLVVHRPEG